MRYGTIVYNYWTLVSLSFDFNLLLRYALDLVIIFVGPILLVFFFLI